MSLVTLQVNRRPHAEPASMQAQTIKTTGGSSKRSHEPRCEIKGLTIADAPEPCLRDERRAVKRPRSSAITGKAAGLPRNRTHQSGGSAVRGTGKVYAKQTECASGWILRFRRIDGYRLGSTHTAFCDASASGIYISGVLASRIRMTSACCVLWSASDCAAAVTALCLARMAGSMTST